MALLSKEKILLYGGSNSGKTHAALEFAQQVIRSGHRVWIIDADDGMAKLITELPQFGDLAQAAESGSLRIETVYDWQDSADAAGQLKAAGLQRGDLVVLEMLGNAWDWSQARFAESVDGQSVAEHQLEKAAHGRVQFGGFEGRSEWPVIKNLYFSITTPTIQTPAHVIWTAASKKVIAENDSEETQRIFKQVGFKYEGSKDVINKMDTIIYLDTDRKAGTRKFSVVKDRGGRQVMYDKVYDNLFDCYYGLNKLAVPWV